MKFKFVFPFFFLGISRIFEHTLNLISRQSNKLKGVVTCNLLGNMKFTNSHWSLSNYVCSACEVTIWCTTWHEKWKYILIEESAEAKKVYLAEIIFLGENLDEHSTYLRPIHKYSYLFIYKWLYQQSKFFRNHSVD